MSNYIYNDNFDNRIKPKPEQEKHGLSISLSIILAICAILILISGILGLIIGRTMNPPTTSNTIYTNTVYVSNNSSPVENNSTGKSRAEIIASIKDTVVEIKTQNVVHSFFQHVTEGAGSGVIVGEYETSTSHKGYYVITNAHVIEGSNSNEIASSITVTLTDGTELSATVKGFDPYGDIAILCVEPAGRTLPVATFINDSSLVNVGDDVIAIGNPLGELGGTVTNGFVSALDREINVDGRLMNLMQTDAAINPGNSGGGLFNLRGELIGIVNAKSSGSGIEGLGFAIPANDALKILTDFINEGYVTGRPTIGITCADSKNGQYVQVITVRQGYNDEVFQVGDKITYVRTPGQTAWSTVTAEALSNFIGNMEIGDKLEICLYRGSTQLIVTAEVFEYVPQ
ncbi:MAG: trypsin-like peptidase domain-containing protein [Clostridia bacterium]|nr:trypsin-like peptidase domain-containing protein [Clostridia bacterium]